MACRRGKRGPGVHFAPGGRVGLTGASKGDLAAPRRSAQPALSAFCPSPGAPSRGKGTKGPGLVKRGNRFQRPVKFLLLRDSPSPGRPAVPLADSDGQSSAPGPGWGAGSGMTRWKADSRLRLWPRLPGKPLASLGQETLLARGQRFRGPAPRGHFFRTGKSPQYSAVPGR